MLFGSKNSINANYDHALVINQTEDIINAIASIKTR